VTRSNSEGGNDARVSGSAGGGRFFCEAAIIPTQAMPEADRVAAIVGHRRSRVTRTREVLPGLAPQPKRGRCRDC